MKQKIIVINFGSTSSKFAVFENDTPVKTGSYEHSRKDLEKFKTINEQLDFRKEHLSRFITENNIACNELSAVVARSGGTAPVYGVYEVNDLMVDKLLNRSPVRHVANLCAPIGLQLAEEYGLPCYTMSFTEDSMIDVAKISGLPQIRRSNEGHMENWYAVSHKASQMIGKPYNQTTMIVAHMGGGTTMGLHQNGKIIDVIGDTEGAFGPERCGGLPISSYLEVAISGDYTADELKNMVRGKGGLYAYTGTTDARIVEEKIAKGNRDYEVIYHAMALQEAKAIAALAATAKGKVDAIALSGGLANSKLFIGWIREYVDFIAPVLVFPGEFEMEAMVMPVIGVLNGDTKANQYTREIDNRG